MKNVYVEKKNAALRISERRVALYYLGLTDLA